MGNLHRRLEQHGQQALLLDEPDKAARKLVEIATGVTVLVVMGMISDVGSMGEPAPANDSKA